MGAVLNLVDYRSYFPEYTDEDLQSLSDLDLYFLGEGTKFESDEWHLISGAKGGKDLSFDVPIGANVRLTQRQDLAKTVKLSAVLATVVKNKKIGGIKPGESLRSHVGDVLNFLRLLRIKYGIENLSSINKQVAQMIVEDYKLSIAARIEVQDKCRQFLIDLSSAEIEELKVERRAGSKPDLNVSMIGHKIGVSRVLLATYCNVQLTHFRAKHGFLIKKNLRQYLELVSDEKPETPEIDSMRKELTSLKKFFRHLYLFSDLFPESHRVSEDFFAELQPSKFAKKFGRTGRRTRNIPREVMFPLMDRAIRWVVYYADELIELRDRALAQYEAYVSESGRGGTEKAKRGYASKRMREWLKTNNIESFESAPGAPWPITGFIKNSLESNRPREISVEQAELAMTLARNGKTYQEAGEAAGISKASVSRLLRQGYAEDGLGLDKVLHCYLPTACLLVIYCFTARRECEIETLTAGCCQDSKSGPYIRMYSAKVHQSEMVFPTTKLVKRAVEILERLTDSVRSENNQRLLQVLSLDDKPQEFWQSGKMQEFADFVGVSAGKEQFQFSEHQFRRFFAMTYFYRFDASDLPTLSWHMRHESFDMTMKYLTDENGRKAFDEVRAEKIADIASQPSVYSGRISQELHELALEAEIHPERRAEKMIDKVKDLGLVMSHVPDGLCFGNSPDLKSRSSCLYKGAVQQSSAVQGACRGCPNLCGFDRPIEESSVQILQSPMLNAAIARVEA